MPKTIDLEKQRKEVRKMVAEIAEIPEKDLKDDARFSEDLGVDSMKALEIVATIEKKFKVIIPENKIPGIRSLKNVYALIESKSGK